MKKIILAAALVLSSGLSFAAAPPDIKVKCTLIEAKGVLTEEITIKYGSGQASLAALGLKDTVVFVNDVEPNSDLHDVKLFVGDQIVTAKGVRVSADHTNGIHISLSQPKVASLFCGI